MDRDSLKQKYSVTILSQDGRFVVLVYVLINKISCGSKETIPKEKQRHQVYQSLESRN